MTATSTKRIPVKSIEINRAEGAPGVCYPSVHDSWTDAEARLLRICLDTPTGSAKCDFEIHWIDGESYKGTISAYHPTHKLHETLGAHCRFYLEYSAGLNCPTFIQEAEYHKSLDESEKRVPGFKASALRMLQLYALSDEHKAESPKVSIDPAPKLDATTSKGSTMTTPSTQTANPSAKDDHNAATALNAGKPLKPVLGNSFPARHSLYRMGGKWDGTAKVWSVPEARHAEATALVAQYDKPKATPKVTPQVPALPGMTPLGLPAAPVKATPVAKTKGPAPKLPPTAINRRLEALLTGAAHLLVDVKGTSAEGALYSVVQILEGIVPGK
jgi:hypothetical protein